MTFITSKAPRCRGWMLAACALLALALAGCATGMPAWTAPTGAAGQAVQPAAAQQADRQASAVANPAGSPAVAQQTGEPLAFRGAVEALPAGGNWAGTWQVGGHAVRVAPSTSVDQRAGRAEPGAQVEVQGWQQPDGTLNAGWVRVAQAGPAASAADASAGRGAAGSAAGAVSTAVTPTVPLLDDAPEPPAVPEKGSPSRWVTETVHPIEFRGLVQMLPGKTLTGTWQVNGHTVNVSDGTDLKLQLGAAEQGAYVQVIGWLQPDGSVNAAKILVKKYEPGKGKQGARTEPEAGEPEASATPEPDETPAVGTAPSDDLTLPPGETEPEGEDDDGGRNWDVRLHGQVEVVTDGPGTWTVDGRQVIVDADTWLKAKQALAAGSWVQIKGFLQPDGSIRATSIQWVHRTPDTRPAAQPVASATPQAAAQGQDKGKTGVQAPGASQGKPHKLATAPAPAPQKPGKSLNPGNGSGGKGNDGGGKSGGAGHGQGSGTGRGGSGNNGKGHK